AYMLRRAGDPDENLERAIRHLLAPLSGPSSPWLTVQRGRIERQLAKAYLDRTLGERADNLASALQHARKAIEVLDPNTDPDEIALAHRLVGHSLAGQHPRTEAETEDAIAHFEPGLAMHIPFDNPL